MNKNILNTGVQDFILKNIDTDIMSVILKKPPFSEISAQELAQQIETKKKCKNKLPLWYKTPNIYYPSRLNFEQSSSETTAKYKSKIIHGKSLLDLTGGFGIDSYFFSKKVDHITYNEVDKELATITDHNLKVLGVKNYTTFNNDAITFLQKNNQYFDWIYLDPSRRDYKKNKVFRLEDCQPDITQNLELIFNRTNYVLLKTSPLLDITLGLKSLTFVKEIHIVAINNEVKELLWVLEKGFKATAVIKTINYGKANKKEVFNFKISDEKNVTSKFAPPQNFLFEPNAAILKSGGFKIIGEKLGLTKISQHTHLYSNDELIDFPGRSFKIEQITKYSKKNVKELQITKANVTTRNFPLSVAQLRQKFKIADGGSLFLFFYKNIDNQHQILICSKI